MLQDSINKSIIDHYKAIFLDIEQLNDHMYVYNEIRSIVQNNPKINIQNSYYTFINECYATTLFMGIRRHVNKYKKHGKQSYSLIYLLIKLKNYFEKKGDHHNSNNICRDIEIIENYAKKYKVITDKVIPHLDKDIIGKSISYNMQELEECVDSLRGCMMNYFHIIYPEDGYIGSNLPDGETWKDIFKTPWIEE